MARLESKFSRPRPKQILVPHLNNWFEAGRFPDEIPFSIHPNKEKDDAFHPSSAHKCARLLYALAKGDYTERPVDGTSHKNFMVGHFYHGLLQWIIVEGLKFCTWDEIEKEHRYETVTDAGSRWWMRGFIDLARVEIPHQGTFLVDIKTVNSNSFRLDQLPASTWDKYYAQVQVYLDWEDLDQCILLCCQKDTPHSFKEFIIDRDPSYVEMIYSRWDTVADALSEGIPPACDCGDEKCPALSLY